MKVRTLLPPFALALALAGTAFAHGSNRHLMGTAESVSADRLVVKDGEGESHDVLLGPKTRYRDAAGAAAKASDLGPGDRVVVHFTSHGSEAPASEVRFADPARLEKSK